MSTLPNEVADIDIIDNEITLYNFNRSKSWNIYHLVNDIDVYESLLNNTLSADIGITEGIEMLNDFPINGEEYIEFSVQKPGQKAISYSFFVESIDAISTNDSSTAKSYILRCVTEDYLTNSYKLFSKRYRDLGYSDSLVKVLREDLGTGKKINFEATKGKFDYVVNNVRPFQVIDLIRERAVSDEKNISSLFFFYEDNEGYNFVTLEKLLEERKSKANNFVFSYDTANRATDYEKVINYRNILYYNTTSQGSSIEKVRSGRMANQVRQFDIYTGTYYDKWEYINQTDYKNFKSADDEKIDFNSDLFNATVTSSPAKSDMVVKDSTRPEMEHNSAITYKRVFQEKIGQYGVTIRVYGDTNILVGDLIRLDIPEITGTTAPPKIQDIYSNNYIILNQRQTFSRRKNDGRFSYYMTLDLRKPNLQGRGIA